MKRPPKYRLNYLFKKLKEEMAAKQAAIRDEAHEEREKMIEMYPKIKFSPEELLELFHAAPLPSKRSFKTAKKKAAMAYPEAKVRAYLMHLTGAQARIDRQEKLFHKGCDKIMKQRVSRLEKLNKAYAEIEEHFMLDGEYDLIYALEDFRAKKF